MPYIKRNNSGKIAAIFNTPQANAEEILSINDPEVIDYLNESQNLTEAELALDDSDLSMIRVIDDLIDTLMDKNVILITDLPPAAREKIANRRKIRSQRNSLNILNDDDSSLI